MFKDNATGWDGAPEARRHEPNVLMSTDCAKRVPVELQRAMHHLTKACAALQEAQEGAATAQECRPGTHKLERLTAGSGLMAGLGVVLGNACAVFSELEGRLGPVVKPAPAKPVDDGLTWLNRRGRRVDFN